MKNLPVNLPRRASSGSRQAITASWANSIRESISRLSNRGVERQKRSEIFKIPPFTPSLCNAVGDGVYYAVVSPGQVTDRVPVEDEDAVISYEPGNLYYLETDAAPEAEPPIVAGALRRFEMSVGDSICVKVEVLATGAIGHASKPQSEWVEIAVGAGVEIESTHYVPPVADDDEGVPGVYYYQLAKLESTATGTKLTPIMSGSHIDHYRERPMMDNVGSGEAKSLKDYDAATDTYRFRSIKGKFGTIARENADDIDIDVDPLNVGTGAAVWMEPDGNTPPFDDEAIKFRTLRGLSSGEATAEGISPQIQVTVEDEPGETASPASQKKTIRIRGNGINGALIFKDCSDNELGRIEWEDGLVITSGDVTILTDNCATDVPP